MNPPVFVFDLDDTLYPERDFARSGFIAAGKWLHGKNGVAGLAEVCWRLFEKGVREKIFDEALRELCDRDPAPDLVGRLVEIYRAHSPDIRLADDARRFLATLSLATPTALITDGLASTQQNKIRALGLEERLNFIVCTDVLGAGFGKPHPRSFRLVALWAKAERNASQFVYVADNPLKDFAAPRALGWLTIQIERPERVHVVTAPDASFEPHGRIRLFDELEACVAELREAVFLNSG